MPPLLPVLTVFEVLSLNCGGAAKEWEAMRRSGASPHIDGQAQRTSLAFILYLFVLGAVNAEIYLREDIVAAFDLGEQGFVDLACLEHFGEQVETVNV